MGRSAVLSTGRASQDRVPSLARSALMSCLLQVTLPTSTTPGCCILVLPTHRLINRTAAAAFSSSFFRFLTHTLSLLPYSQPHQVFLALPGSTVRTVVVSYCCYLGTAAPSSSSPPPNYPSLSSTTPATPAIVSGATAGLKSSGQQPSPWLTNLFCASLVYVSLLTTTVKLCLLPYAHHVGTERDPARLGPVSCCCLPRYRRSTRTSPHHRPSRYTI